MDCGRHWVQRDTLARLLPMHQNIPSRRPTLESHSGPRVRRFQRKHLLRHDPPHTCHFLTFQGARPRRALNGKEATNFDTHVFFSEYLCCRQDIIDQEIEDAAALPCRWTSRVWELEGVHGILRCRVVTHKAQGDLRHLAFCGFRCPCTEL